jgi:hypothetical protein
MNTKESLYRKTARIVSTIGLGALLFTGVAVAPAQAQIIYRDHRFDRNDRYYGPNRVDFGFIAQQAQQVGYRDGFERGQYDRSIGVRRPNPQGHGAFQFGLDGWQQDWGAEQSYRMYFRQAFLRGYWDGYRRGY